CRKAGRKKKQLNEGVEKDEEERINRRREGNGGKRTKPECFFFCRNIGGEYCLYISSSSNPMSIMECLTLQKKSAAG
ncbi:hypothetical protein L0P53_13600, partial [Holdemanella sp. DFI.5.21]|nr:hypothetical protein [Holdemanella sp. DFI.5.21]